MSASGTMKDPVFAEQKCLLLKRIKQIVNIRFGC